MPLLKTLTLEISNQQWKLREIRSKGSVSNVADASDGIGKAGMACTGAAPAAVAILEGD